MINTERYYKATKDIKTISLILMSAVGLPLSVFLGSVYGYGSNDSYLIMRLVMPIVFGMCIGSVIGFIGFLLKEQRCDFWVLYGLILGLIAKYIGWVFYIYAESNHQLLEFKIGNVLDSISFLAKNGTWSIFGWTPTGAILYIIWFIETIFFMLITSGALLLRIGSKPFCEKCNKRIKSTIITSQLEAVKDKDSLIFKLENYKFEDLLNLNHIDGKEKERTQVELLSCPVCKDKYYIVLKSITIDISNNGVPVEKKDSFVENMIVSYEVSEKIKNLKK